LLEKTEKHNNNTTTTHTQPHTNFAQHNTCTHTQKKHSKQDQHTRTQQQQQQQQYTHTQQTGLQTLIQKNHRQLSMQQHTNT
jgi:hypothetical protein